MDTMIRFRATSEDRVRYEAAARGDGLKLSEWIRGNLDRAADGQKLSEAVPLDIRYSQMTGKRRTEASFDEPETFAKPRPEIDPDKVAAAQEHMAASYRKGKK